MRFCFFFFFKSLLASSDQRVGEWGTDKTKLRREESFNAGIVPLRMPCAFEVPENVIFDSKIILHRAITAQTRVRV